MKLEKIFPNLHIFQHKGRELFFSYETLIAFSIENNTIVSENVWTRTTGKHINWIKTNRNATQVSNGEFLDSTNILF